MVIGLEDIGRNGSAAGRATRRPLTFRLVALFAYLAPTILSDARLPALERRYTRGLVEAARAFPKAPARSALQRLGEVDEGRNERKRLGVFGIKHADIGDFAEVIGHEPAHLAGVDQSLGVMLR